MFPTYNDCLFEKHKEWNALLQTNELLLTSVFSDLIKRDREKRQEEIDPI